MQNMVILAFILIQDFPTDRISQMTILQLVTSLHTIPLGISYIYSKISKLLKSALGHR